MILALNTGFYNTKVKNISTSHVQPTRIQINDTGNSTLTINNVTYEVGNGSRDIADKQLSVVHKVCTEYNILKYSSATDMQLVVALPMSRYLDKQYREHYRISLMGLHEGYVDGEYKRININECTVFAEGAATYLLYKEAFKNKVIGLLDFGGNTINCMIYSYGHLLKDTITTLDLGMIKLERYMIDEINTAMGWNVQEYEVREIIQTGECKEIVEKCVRIHLNEVRQRLLEKKWNIDRLTIFATGGGSIDLNEQLKSAFKRIIISPNGLWDNVDGLLLVGSEIYEKKH